MSAPLTSRRAALRGIATAPLLAATMVKAHADDDLIAKEKVINALHKKVEAALKRVDDLEEKASAATPPKPDIEKDGYGDTKEEIYRFYADVKAWDAEKNRITACLGIAEALAAACAIEDEWYDLLEGVAETPVTTMAGLQCKVRLVPLWPDSMPKGIFRDILAMRRAHS